VATIREIAREAGVSVGTVSNVLNGHVRVSDEIRERVLQVMARHDYRPSAVARSLATRKTYTLGLIVSLYPSSFYTEIAQGAVQAARAAGTGLMVVASDYDARDLSEQVALLTNQWVDGIFIATQPVEESTMSQIDSRGTCLVMMDRGQTPPEGTVGVIGFDWFGAAYAATQHLVALGHRRIGYVGGIPGRSSSVQRERGYRQAMTDAGLGEGAELIRDGDFFTESGYLRASELLALAPRPTALFMANDLMALGALKAVAEQGLKVPDDIAIAGVDDANFTSFLSPPLTTVHVPTIEAGKLGIEMLLQRPEEGAPLRRTVLPTSLVVRGSTGPAAAA
jgi:LacI family transcriptional regulator